MWYRVGAPGDNLKLGREAGEEIRAEAGEKFFEELMAYVQDIQVRPLFYVSVSGMACPGPSALAGGQPNRCLAPSISGSRAHARG